MTLEEQRKAVMTEYEVLVKKPREIDDMIRKTLNVFL